MTIARTLTFLTFDMSLSPYRLIVPDLTYQGCTFTL
ncbi:hypothetical protein PANI_CDS0005 [Maribacter phage Panino]